MSVGVKVKSLSRVQLFATPWTAASQAPPSMGFSRQEYWSGLLFPSPEDLPNSGTEPGSPALQADALPSKATREAWCQLVYQFSTYLSSTWSEVKWSRSVVSNSLRPHRLQPARLLCPWDFPGNSTGVDCHFLLQGIFPNQGSNLGLPHCRRTLYHLNHIQPKYDFMEKEMILSQLFLLSVW